MEKLYHLEAQCVSYIKLNIKVGLLHTIDQGDKLANLRGRPCGGEVFRQKYLGGGSCNGQFLHTLYFHPNLDQKNEF